MKKLVLFLLALVIVPTLSIISLASCTSDETGQESILNEAACPDNLLRMSEASLSSSVDENGRPINATNVFTKNTPEIFFSIVLSFDEVCCSIVTVQWIYEGDVIDMWQDYSNYPSIVSLKSPESGFAKGKYEVTVSIDVSEIARVPFTIE